MKVVSCGLAQRILVIHRGLTREYPKYPLTQSVGRENLSGESLVSCAPSRFSLEILPPSLLRSGIFTDTHSFAPEYYYIIHRQTREIMAIFLRENHKGRSPEWFSRRNIAIIPEFGGNNVFLSLGELNISSLFSAEWLPQNMGFYSPLQCHGYSTVAPLEEK